MRFDNRFLYPDFPFILAADKNARGLNYLIANAKKYHLNRDIDPIVGTLSTYD